MLFDPPMCLLKKIKCSDIKSKDHKHAPNKREICFKTFLNLNSIIE